MKLCTGSVKDSNGWYLVDSIATPVFENNWLVGYIFISSVLGQYTACMPLYIERVEIWSSVTDPSHTQKLRDLER